MIDFSDLASMKGSPSLRLALCAEALVLRGRWEIDTGFDPTPLITALKEQLALVKPEKPNENRATIVRLSASLSRLARAAWLFGALQLRSETAEDEWYDLTPVFHAQADLQRELDPDASAKEARKAMRAALALAATVRSDEPYKIELKRIAAAINKPDQNDTTETTA